MTEQNVAIYLWEWEDWMEGMPERLEPLYAFARGARLNPIAYVDAVPVGGEFVQPQLKQLLADVALGQVQVVLVDHFACLASTPCELAEVMHYFARHKVRFISQVPGLDTGELAGRLVLNVLLELSSVHCGHASEPSNASTESPAEAAAPSCKCKRARA